MSDRDQLRQLGEKMAKTSTAKPTCRRQEWPYSDMDPERFGMSRRCYLEIPPLTPKQQRQHRRRARVQRRGY